MTPTLASAVEHYRRRRGIESQQIRAALIDMDGTLFDSMPNHSSAWEQLAREEGLHYEPGEFFLHEGRTGFNTIDILFRRSKGRPATEQEKETLYRRKTEYFRLLPEPKAIEGAACMLRAFRDNGVRRILVTGSGQSSLINRVEVEFDGLFTSGMRVTSRDYIQGKPHPEPFLKGMSLLGASPEESIVVENAPMGVAAGFASGAFTVAVATGPIPEQTLLEAGADIVCSSMQEFADALPQLLILMTNKTM